MYRCSPTEAVEIIIILYYVYMIGHSRVWRLQSRECLSQVFFKVDNTVWTNIITSSLRYCLAYVFGDLLQKDIDEFVDDWNSHSIRKNRFSKGPFGRPTDMYDMPGQYGKYYC